MPAAGSTGRPRKGGQHGREAARLPPGLACGQGAGLRGADRGGAGRCVGSVRERGWFGAACPGMGFGIRLAGPWVVSRGWGWGGAAAFCGEVKPGAKRLRRSGLLLGTGCLCRAELGGEARTGVRDLQQRKRDLGRAAPWSRCLVSSSAGGGASGGCAGSRQNAGWAALRGGLTVSGGLFGRVRLLGFD